jgi:hypothetical protein
MGQFDSNRNQNNEFDTLIGGGLLVAFVVIVGRGVVAAAVPVATTFVAVLGAISQALAGPYLVISIVSWNCVCGLLAGFIIGIVRAVFRIRSKIAELTIGSAVSERVITSWSEVPGAYLQLFYTIATNSIVGYAVGLLMALAGLPPLYGHHFAGSVAAIVGASGTGGPDAGLLWMLGFVIMVVGIVFAICFAITLNLVFAVSVGAFGGSLEEVVKLLTIRVVEFLGGKNAAKDRNRPVAALILDALVTGFLVGSFTSFAFALNAANIDPLSFAFGLYFCVQLIVIHVNDSYRSQTRR